MAHARVPVLAPYAERRRADALLGDTVLRTYVGLLGAQAGLSACQMDEITRSCLSNDALKQTASYNTATLCEAAVGGKVKVGSHSALLKALRADVQRAAPEVLRAIEEEVAQPS